MKPIFAIIVGAAVALGGCSADHGSRTDGASGAGTMTVTQQAKVAKGAAVAKAIRANPDNADTILRQNNMSEQEFEDLMYEIAADPAMSQAYNERMGR